MSAQPDRPDDELCIEDFIDLPETPQEAESEFERLTGVTTLTERQEPQSDRLVDEDTAKDIQRATADGHDYSDCGGAQ